MHRLLASNFEATSLCTLNIQIRDTRVTHLSALQGASEEQTEPYINTVKEYRSWQRSQRAKSSRQDPALPELDCYGV